MRYLVMTFAVLTWGCGAPESAPEPEPGPEYYESTGSVVGIEEGHVLLDHGDIPGFMDAMTMSYPVSDPALLEGLEEGARVSFRVVVEDSSYEIDRIEVVSPP